MEDDNAGERDPTRGRPVAALLILCAWASGIDTNQLDTRRILMPNKCGRETTRVNASMSMMVDFSTHVVSNAKQGCQTIDGNL